MSRISPKPARFIVLGLCVVGVAVGCVVLGYPGIAASMRWHSPRGIAVILMSSYILFWTAYWYLNRSSPGTKLARCLLSTAAFLIPLLLAESLVYFRLVDFNRIFQGANHPVGLASLNSNWWRLDNELIHMRYPNMHIKGRTIGDIAHRLRITDRSYSVDARYDANGFRNDRQFKRAPIAVIGDSFVEAGIVPARQIFTRQMSDDLDIRVANLGVTMYGPQQELAVLRRYGIPLQPQVVVWMFFEGNDLSDAYRYPSHRKAATSDFDSFTRRSFSRNVLVKMVGLSQMAIPRPDLLEHSCEVAIDHEPHRLFFRYKGGPLRDEELRGLEVVKQTVRQASQLCDEADARFLFVFVPTKFRVYEDIGEFPPSFRTGRWRSNDLPEQMSNWCSDLDIEFVDLTPVLKSAASEQLLYFSDDSHWSAAGHNLVGHELAHWIVERGWLSGTQ